MSDADIPRPGQEPGEQRPAGPPRPEPEAAPARPGQQQPGADRPGAGQNENGQNRDGQNGGGQKKEPPGPGKGAAGKAQIVVLALILLAMIVVVFSGLLVFWPHPTPSTAGLETPQDSVRQPPASQDTTLARRDTTRAPADTTRRPSTDTARTTDTLRQGLAARSARPPETAEDSAASPCAKREAELRRIWARDKKHAPAECMQFLRWEVLLWDEKRLLILVMLAGALGGLLHALRSFGWYVGNRELVQSWVPWYLILPFSGAGLAFVFYVVVRGGFFSPVTTIEATSPFGFVAFGLLVGFFSEQAVLKLKQVAETIFSKPVEGRDTAPPQDLSRVPAPKIDSVTREGGTNTFVIRGSGFVQQSEVSVNGTKQAAAFVSANELRVTLATAPAGPSLRVEVRNPGDKTAEKDVPLQAAPGGPQ